MKELLAKSVVSSLDILDAQLKRDDFDPETKIRVRNNALYAASEALDTADSLARKKIESWLGAHTDDMAQLDPCHLNRETDSIDGTPFRTLANVLARAEDIETFKKILGLIRIDGESTDAYSKVVDPLLKRSGGEQPLLVGKQAMAAELMADKLGLSPLIPEKWGESMVFAKTDAAGNEIFRPSYSENIHAMMALEEKSPGASMQLFERFGVANLSRYDSGMLLRQLEKADTDVPYGLVVYPEADHNGAFSQTGSQLAEMALKLRMGGLETRIIEVGSQKALARQLVTMDKRYSPAGNKIGFAVIGGHGSETSVTFGRNKRVLMPPIFPEEENYIVEYAKWRAADKGAFTKHDIDEGRGIQRASEEFFDTDAPVVLVSCSTGVVGGIAQTVSGEYGWTVAAPKVPTNVRDIGVSFDTNNKPKFDVEYFEEGSAMTYHAGKQNGPHEADGAGS
jgi:hypothetical protein